MPSSSGDPAQTPDHKSTGGLAGVFKSLAGKARATQLSPLPFSSISTAPLQHLYGSPGASVAVYGSSSGFEELCEQLKPGRALADRLVAADALRLALADYPISSILRIWHGGRDLIQPANPLEARQTGFELLISCVKHAPSSTDLERKDFFDTLTAPLAPEDFYLQLAAVTELAKHGKDLSGFYYEIIPLLTRWLHSAFLAFEESRKAKSGSSKHGLGRAPPAEETNLHHLFDFIIDVIKFSFHVSTEEDTGRLISVVIEIAMSARFPSELGACVRVLDAIVTYGAIPSQNLPDCVKILCSIHCLVRDIRNQAWRTISNLCQSHNGHATIDILLDIIRHPQLERPSQVREIRGALSVLEKTAAENGENGFPLLPFSLLMDALDQLLTVEHAKVESDILKLLLAVFLDESDAVRQVVMEEDWALMFDVAARCSLRQSESVDSNALEPRVRAMSPLSIGASGDSSTSPAAFISQQLRRLITKVEELLEPATAADLLQKEECIAFFIRVHDHLPDSCAKLVIGYYAELRLCYPSDPEWRANIRLLIGAFLSVHSRPAQVRIQTLKAVTDVYEMAELMSQETDPDYVSDFVSSIIKDLAEENDIAVLHEIIAFAVRVAGNADQDVFELIMKELHHAVSNDQLQSLLSSPGSRHGSGSSAGPASTSSFDSPAVVPTPSNIITKGFIQIFMRAMHTSVERASRAFDAILWIARSSGCDTDARISAMKMLFRLRADWAYRIFLTPFTESEELAASLYRTAPSLAKKHAEDEASQQPSRVVRPDDPTLRTSRSASSGQLHTLSSKPVSRALSGVNRTLRHTHQMWMSPDPDALPEYITDKSSILLACLAEASDVTDKDRSSAHRVLKMNVWLETLIALLQQGSDWEIYSYILVHLASQLTNRALFRDSMTQINELRRLLCEQLKNNSFQEPPVSSGLRKADVAICLFHILTMLISYHEHFTKPEKDEIVRAFVQGVTTWERTAKCCIHALTICCHELPASMRVSLFSTLQKMSQIITQSHVAVHILEFLACLARLPDLYANFREEDYRIVFGISFRYIQYVRARSQDVKPTSNRLSNPAARHVSTPEQSSKAFMEPNLGENNLLPNASDELAQYVYALTYHVITFWFLALRLSDRAAQVSWIIKNLVWTDAAGTQQMDEQAEVIMDFIQRTAFANVDDTKANVDFTEERYGEILKRRWIVGQSIVTIEQASRSDWAQITKRQASATSHYMVHEQFERPPPHQMLNFAGDSRYSEANAVLPHYLLLQFGAVYLMRDTTRPIPLPDDEATKRAISIFDRISTIDGHKVGVIYIGIGQTQEIEILSNVAGSSDYTTFLSGLGNLTKLQGATFNTQGLDRQGNTDGEYTYCWRDRVTEIVFHVTTLMPTNLEIDPQCISKKQHIGNDFVNIIFNNSGQSYGSNTFPTDFNYVNIVITPETRASFVATRLRPEAPAQSLFYKVQVISKPGVPGISPAAETKIVSLQALPGFIRLLALNASVFSLVWANREGGEHVSSWRSRLRAIKRLRDQNHAKSSGGNKAGVSTASPPGTASSHPPEAVSKPRDSLIGSRRASVATYLTGTSDSPNDRSSKHLSSGDTYASGGGSGSGSGNMMDALDFSKWA
ncbi:MAG: Tuberous sclerosis 2-like protein [Claussenomyces sp. TS43310]|nr:MAG: Tuberous sclerosis 2-like protein [Claussenomyces sp. TS43310]